MPTLIVSSRFNTDSQRLRQAAQERGWETLRLDGWQLPEWFEPADDQTAIYFAGPAAFEVADQLSLALVGCSPDWILRLPPELTQRATRMMPLSEALGLPGTAFIKHSVSKAFPAAVYNAATLAKATEKIPPAALLHICEIVDWTVEYRCFVADGKVAAISPYKRHGVIISDHSMMPETPASEVDDARGFADRVLSTVAAECPASVVLDVGIIAGRGWAVIEVNECWACGIYACNPCGVLDTLLRACVPVDSLSAHPQWDFQQHYLHACARS